MSSEEKKQKQMKDQLEAGYKFKVPTKAEYEALLLPVCLFVFNDAPTLMGH